MNAMINTGIYVKNKPSSAKDAKTIVVLGLGRSGTSMIARVLSHMGVFLGDNFDQAVFEDVEIAQALESKNDDAFKQIVADRNDRYELWGWKRPSSIHFVSTINQYVRNPHYIVVYRDILSIALRNHISMDQSLDFSLNKSIENYKQLNEFVAQVKAPTLLISYEKAITKRRKFIRALHDFLSLETNQKRIKELTALIELDRKLYIENTRVKKP